MYAPSIAPPAPCQTQKSRRLTPKNQTPIQVYALACMTLSGIFAMRLFNQVICVDTESFNIASVKEVIQPQVPLRLPCYDFTPVMNHKVVTVLRS